MRIDELLNAVVQLDAVLRDHVLDRKRLPPIRIDHRRAGCPHDEGRIDRLVLGGVSLRLIGAVRESSVQDRPRDSIATAAGSSPSVSHLDGVAEFHHEGVQRRDGFYRSDRVDVPGLEDSVCRIADRLIPGSIGIRR